MGLVRRKVPGSASSAVQEDRVGAAQREAERARYRKRGPPARRVDEPAGEQGGAGHPHVSEHAVDRQRHAGPAAPLHHQGEADRMVDRGEQADQEQAGTDLERGVRECGDHAGRAEAEEEDDHHGFAAPLVSNPACRKRTDAECDQPGRRIWDQFGIGNIPFVHQHECRRGRKDQNDQVIKEMAEIEEQEADAVASQRTGPPISICNTTSGAGWQDPWSMPTQGVIGEAGPESMIRRQVLVADGCRYAPPDRT